MSSLPVGTLAPPAKAPLAGRTNSGGFKTTEGTLYVSQPFRSKSSKKLRALITFAPRKSHFDTTNELSGTNEFRVSVITVPESCFGYTDLASWYTGLLYFILDIHVSVHGPDVHH